MKNFINTKIMKKLSKKQKRMIRMEAGLNTILKFERAAAIATVGTSAVLVGASIALDKGWVPASHRSSVKDFVNVGIGVVQAECIMLAGGGIAATGLALALDNDINNY